MTGIKPMLLLAMLSCVSLPVAPARATVHGEITDYGETTADQERPAPRTTDDHTLVPRTTLQNIRTVDHASTLPAEFCLRFGATIRLTSDDGEPLPSRLIVVFTHPRITRPRDQASSTQDSFPAPVLDGTAYAGWTFDHDWEQEPGEWTVAFTDGGEVLAARTFTITPPTPFGSRCPPNPVS